MQWQGNVHVPSWIGVAVLFGDGQTQAWQLNAADGALVFHTSQTGVWWPNRRPTEQELADILVGTRLEIRGMARRWGPWAGSGTPFIIPTKEIGS